MSTVDRVIVYDEPCPCGKGKITVTECSPDHPYAKDSQTWYQADLSCANCSQNFKFDEVIEDTERSIVLRELEGGVTIFIKYIRRYCRGLSK